MSEWQDISTAPKSGEAVLVCGGLWQSELSRAYPNDEARLVRWGGSGWDETGGAYYSSWVIDPTHWAPVPALPAKPTTGE